MRILVHDYAGHPFQVQLSRELARRGQEVLHLYCGSFQTPHGNLLSGADDPMTFDCRPLNLGNPIDKYSYAKRFFQELEYGKLLATEVENFAPQVVISSNTPLDPQGVLQKHCRRQNIGFIFWVQDLYGVAIEKILTKKNGLLGRLIGGHYQNKEQRLLRAADAAVVISEDFLSLCHQAGVPGEKVYVIHNWAPLAELPVLPKKNPWAGRHGLEHTFNFVYSGTLGMKHNPSILLDLARALTDWPDARVVVISEGLGADLLAKHKAQLGLGNLVLLPFQSFEQMPAALAAADVLMAILEPDAGIFAVPSKVLTCLCAARPLLLAMPRENLVARIVAENKAGKVVSPKDIAGFIHAAKVLMKDVELRRNMATNGRAYAESTFNIERITDQFENIISDVLSIYDK